MADTCTLTDHRRVQCTCMLWHHFASTLSYYVPECLQLYVVLFLFSLHSARNSYILCILLCKLLHVPIHSIVSSLILFGLHWLSGSAYWHPCRGVSKDACQWSWRARCSLPAKYPYQNCSCQCSRTGGEYECNQSMEGDSYIGNTAAFNCTSCVLLSRPLQSYH